MQDASTPGRSIEVYVHLLDEGTPCIRPTQGVVVAPGVVRLQATPNYDSVDETWEFTPGTLVTVEVQIWSGGPCLVAVAEARGG
ncbi:MAG: hypothetical protein HZA53_15225 [Planctomycetes bacterium]|nr:hypothetical protein [Planctomycetota bacterium]